MRGAKKGLHTAVQILPTMVGMLTVVYMLRASGAIDLAAAALAPLYQMLGIPQNAQRSPCSSRSAAAAGWRLGSEIMQRCGPDSYAGRVAAVMLGASETSLYTLSIYSGHLGLRRMRYAVLAALCADVTAFAVFGCALSDYISQLC